MDETLKIIKEIFDYNKNAQKIFPLASRVDKGKSEPKVDKGKSEPKADRRKLEPKPEQGIAKRVILKREKIDEIKEKEKNINYELLKEYFTNYQSSSHMYKELRMIEGTRNENQVYLIKEVLNEMKKANKNVPENKTFMIEENEKIINIVEGIIYFNQLDQSGKGQKILTTNQILSRLPITLAQLKAGNNSEKLKNQIRQILYSLHSSKKLTKQLYKSLIDII